MDVMTAQDVRVETAVGAKEQASLPPVLAQVEFPKGLIGCADWKRFELRGNFEYEPAGLLICLDDPDRIFFVSPLEYAAPGGLMRFNNEDTRALRRDGVGERDDVMALATLNVDDAGNFTANLLGPLVIDLTAGQGRQLVLSDLTLSTRHRLLADQSDGAE
jgi:flagellar assembly factor FliW